MAQKIPRIPHWDTFHTERDYDFAKWNVQRLHLIKFRLAGEMHSRRVPENSPLDKRSDSLFMKGRRLVIP
jgi:hypothetical protein